MASKPSVLITGSSGLIGRALARRLAGEYELFGLDRDDARDSAEILHFERVDLTSDDSLRSALGRVAPKANGRLASVVHLAAYYDFSGRPSPKYDAITVDGTRRLVEGLKALKIKTEQLIFSSTMLVHSPTVPGRKINEDWPTEGRWPYPDSKIKTESLLSAIRGDIPVVKLRIAGVYHDRGGSIPIAHQVHHIYERWLTSHVFPGDPGRGQAFVHLDDLLEAFASAIDRRARLPADLALLIGEPETLAYRTIQDAVGRLLFGGGWRTLRIPKTAAKAGSWMRSRLPFRPEPLMQPKVIAFADDHYELDVSRAERWLDWKPKRSLLQTLPKIVEALRRDPLRWYAENKIEPPKALRREKIPA